MNPPHAIQQPRQMRLPRKFQAKLRRLRKAGLLRAGPVYVARAPARLDVMGGIADYSGGLVLEMPLWRSAWAAVQFCDDKAVTVHSYQAEAEGWSTPVAVSWSRLAAKRLRRPDTVARIFGASERWAAYPVGVVYALARWGLMPAGQGVRIVIDSDVPMGAGIASSGALEVAVAAAAIAAAGARADGLQLARLCQWAENHIALAPCGIMDQVTAALGRAGHLLALLCQPHNIRGFCRLPAGVIAAGIDTGVKHAVGGRKYTRTRVATFMGWKIITSAAARSLRAIQPPFGSHLAHTPDNKVRFRAAQRRKLSVGPVRGVHQPPRPPKPLFLSCLSRPLQILEHLARAIGFIDRKACARPD